jgi:single-strand DNA-binding protein
MLIVTATGNIGKDAETRSTQAGDKVTSFSLGTKNGTGRDAGTIWLRCSIWGKRGESLAQYLTKGGSVTVVGDLTVGEYEGKPQYDLRVHDVALQGGKQDSGSRDTGRRDEPRRASRDDLDDDVPF